MSELYVPIVELPDDVLAQEIEAARAEACCATAYEAAQRRCGCRGSREYLDALEVEQLRRNDIVRIRLVDSTTPAPKAVYVAIDDHDFTLPGGLT